MSVNFIKTKLENKTVNDFARMVKTLIESGLVDKGVLISYSDFSTQAYDAAKATGIELRKFEDIRTTNRKAKETPELSQGETLNGILKEKEEEEKAKRNEHQAYLFLYFFPRKWTMFIT